MSSENEWYNCYYIEDFFFFSLFWKYESFLFSFLGVPIWIQQKNSLKVFPKVSSKSFFFVFEKHKLSKRQCFYVKQLIPNYWWKRHCIKFQNNYWKIDISPSSGKRDIGGKVSQLQGVHVPQIYKLRRKCKERKKKNWGKRWNLEEVQRLCLACWFCNAGGPLRIKY